MNRRILLSLIALLKRYFGGCVNSRYCSVIVNMILLNTHSCLESVNWTLSCCQLYHIVRDSNIKGFEKEDSKGRIDYWCIYKDYSIVIEMKHSYDAFKTDLTNDERLIKRWETMTISQLQDVRKNVKYFSEKTKGVIRIGLHFITPYCNRDGDMDDVANFMCRQKEILMRLSRDVSCSKPQRTTPNFLASWVLPNNKKYFEVPYKGTYPGLLLLGKIFPSIAHEGSISMSINSD